MLLELRIENLAVIERASATFGPGLNAVTGETGAGKSVLLAALALALGGGQIPPWCGLARSEPRPRRFFPKVAPVRCLLVWELPRTMSWL